MTKEELILYEIITQNYPVPDYHDPESQGASIKRCSILQETEIAYGKDTELLTSKI